MPQLNLNFNDIPILETCLWEQFDDHQKRVGLETLAHWEQAKRRELSSTPQAYGLFLHHPRRRRARGHDGVRRFTESRRQNLADIFLLSAVVVHAFLFSLAKAEAGEDSSAEMSTPIAAYALATTPATAEGALSAGAQVRGDDRGMMAVALLHQLEEVLDCSGFRFK